MHGITRCDGRYSPTSNALVGVTYSPPVHSLSIVGQAKMTSSYLMYLCSSKKDNNWQTHGPHHDPRMAAVYMFTTTSVSVCDALTSNVCELSLRLNFRKATASAWSW